VTDPAADKFKGAVAAQQAGEEQLAAAAAQAAALQREVDGREHTIGWLEGQVGALSLQPCCGLTRHPGAVALTTALCKTGGLGGCHSAFRPALAAQLEAEL
jgi:hypothetical protein